MFPFLVLLALGSPDLTRLTVDLTTVEEHATTTQDLMAIATSSAAKYGLSKKQTARMLKVIDCESGWSATSTSPTGDYGIAQLNRAAHPEITKQQMFDPIWSLDWMAEQWSYGHQTLWVCFSKLFS